MTMSATTYKLILVGPGWATTSSEVDAATSWLPLNNDEPSADVKDYCIELNACNNATDDINSASERARRLLEELEKEGNSLEDALQESFVPSDGLAVFGDIPSLAPVVEQETPTLVLNCLATSVDTEALLRDLEAMLPEVTPPQSPPTTNTATTSDDQTMLSDIDELLFLRSLSLPDPEPYMPLTPSTSNNSSPCASPSMASPYHSPSTPMSQLSPCYAPSTPASESSVLSSPCQAPSTPSSAGWESDSTSDPDWTMDQSPGPSRARVAAAPRPKPYARTSTTKARQPQDRRERKKMQNKNAATRYRMKKKAEEEELMSQEDELSDKNEDLKNKVSDLYNEIRIIKGLLRDQCKRLGIIKD